TICIFSQTTNCAAFTVDRSNGTKPVSRQMDISNVGPGRHRVQVKINEVRLDTTIGYFNIVENRLSPACDTIESYVGVGSIKTYRNTPLYENHKIELSLVRNNSDTSGIFSITYNQCK